MQVSACTGFSINILNEGMPIAATEIDFFCGSSADAGGSPWHVRFGSSRRHDRIYSITPSAVSKIDCGTSTPSALAVLRLTVSSYLVGA
jgi:hypothetical protein